MKKTTLLISAIALSITSFWAQTTLEVGEGKTFTTLSSAWDAAKTDPATDITIKIAEGTYVESANLQAMTNKNIVFVGAGADKTILKKPSTTPFTLPGTEGWAANSPKRLFTLVKSCDNLSLTFEKLSFETMGYNDANGGGVINAEGVNQKFTFNYCNFNNIMARAGGIIQIQGTDQASLITFDHCFVENCGVFDNNGFNSLIFYKNGSCVVKNTTFMNNNFNALNIGKTDPGTDRNLHSGALINGNNNAKGLNIENCYLVNNKFLFADIDKTHPLISMNSSIGAESITIVINELISVGNNRAASLDCDLYYQNTVTPFVNNTVVNAVRSFERVSAGDPPVETINDADVTTLTGAAIDPTLTYTSPEVNFEMDGALPKIVVGAYGVKHLNRVIAGVKAEQVNNLKIKNNNGLVSITSEIPENITIYTILGARVAEYFKVKEIEIPLSTGTYIIRSLSTNTKLLIK